MNLKNSSSNEDMEDCVLITTSHDESMTLKAIIESKCIKCILLYQHSFEKLPEGTLENIDYIKIEGNPEDCLSQINSAIKDVKNSKFFLANVHLDIYLLYYILRKKESFPIWILDNNQFLRMPEKI